MHRSSSAEQSAAAEQAKVVLAASIESQKAEIAGLQSKIAAMVSELSQARGISSEAERQLDMLRKSAQSGAGHAQATQESLASELDSAKATMKNERERLEGRVVDLEKQVTEGGGRYEELSKRLAAANDEISAVSKANRTSIDECEKLKKDTATAEQGLKTQQEQLAAAQSELTAKKDSLGSVSLHNGRFWLAFGDGIIASPSAMAPNAAVGAPRL